MSRRWRVAKFDGNLGHPWVVTHSWVTVFGSRHYDRSKGFRTWREAIDYAVNEANGVQVE